jgi:hypothetical protein
MWLFHHHPKAVLPASFHENMRKAEADQEKAKEELSLAKKLAMELAEIREQNHFVKDWRKAIGIKDGH